MPGSGTVRVLHGPGRPKDARCAARGNDAGTLLADAAGRPGMIGGGPSGTPERDHYLMMERLGYSLLRVWIKTGLMQSGWLMRPDNRAGNTWSVCNAIKWPREPHRKSHLSHSAIIICDSLDHLTPERGTGEPRRVRGGPYLRLVEQKTAETSKNVINQHSGCGSRVNPVLESRFVSINSGRPPFPCSSAGYGPGPTDCWRSFVTRADHGQITL